MFPRIKNARYIQDFVLEFTFIDGAVGRMDFRNRILNRGGVFEALQQIPYFKQVQVDVEAGTVVWPNGVDFDPDVIYCETMGIPVPEFELA